MMTVPKLPEEAAAAELLPVTVAVLLLPLVAVAVLLVPNANAVLLAPPVAMAVLLVPMAPAKSFAPSAVAVPVPTTKATEFALLEQPVPAVMPLIDAHVADATHGGGRRSVTGQ